MTAQITQLRVGDENFLVTSMIDRCPRSMMLRELVRNAVEAAQTAPPGEGRVEISGIEIEGAMKLAIWNSGRGMDPEELFRMCDIASSIRKENRLDQNFGMGAKVASLPSNRHGMRYRSCHEGRVCEVMIGSRGGVYGRLRRVLEGSDSLHDVLDVTEEALAEGRSLEQDWTEVVLLGNHAAQHTLSDPYDGEPRMPSYWIAEELQKKFFRLPHDIPLILHETANISGELHRFRSVAERLGGHYTRHERVPIEDGVTLHYVHDGLLEGDPSRTRASLGAPYFVHGFAGLVYKDEIYDISWHQEWLHMGPVYGIPFCGRNVSVFVEFAPDHPILPDGYRQFVRHREGLQAQLFLREYASRIHANRPQWLIDLIQRHAPDSTLSDEISASLRRLLRELRVPRRLREISPPARPPEQVSEQVSEQAPEQVSEPAAPEQAGEGAPEAALPQDQPASAQPDRNDAADRYERDEQPDDTEFEAAPQIIMLRDETEAQARGVADRGARYYGETHQLFVNCLYPAVEAMRTTLEREFGWTEDQQTVHASAQRSAEQSLVERVGRMLVFALAKQGSWSDWEMSYSLSTPALTMAADDYHQSLPAARAALRASLRLRQLTDPVAQ